MNTNRRGFTLLEVTIALVLAGILLTGIWTLFVSVNESEKSSFREADRRASEISVRVSLGGALLRAGRGLPGSANFAGLHVQMGSTTDTLYLLEAVGPRVRVASRSCRAGVSPECIVLLGDHRRRFPAGTLVVVGTEAAGVELRFVASEAVAFSDACGPDCMERILCAFTASADTTAPNVGGSVHFAPGDPTGTASPEPCPQPRFADGSRCEENATTVAVRPMQADYCVTGGPAATFTEVRTVPAGEGWDLPSQGAPAALRAGAVATPGPVAQAAGVTRYWIRDADSTLIRQRGLLMAGGWSITDRVAGPVLALRVETLHAGESAWRRGIGVSAADLARGSGNTNLVRAAPADGAPRAWTFLRGYHTIAAARLTYQEMRPVGVDSLAVDSVKLVSATPGLRSGTRPAEVQ